MKKLYDKIEDTFVEFYNMSVKVVVFVAYKDSNDNKRHSIHDNERVVTRYSDCNTESTLRIYAPTCGITFESKNSETYESVFVNMNSCDLLTEQLGEYRKKLLDFSKVFKYSDGIPTSVFPDMAEFVQIGPFNGKSMFIRPFINDKQHESVEININGKFKTIVNIDMFLGMSYTICKMDMYNATRNLLALSMSATDIGTKVVSVNPRKS